MCFYNILIHMYIPHVCVFERPCVNVCMYLFTGFLPCGAVEFLVDYRSDTPLCPPAEAGAPPLVVLAPSVPPSSPSPQVQDATSHAELFLYLKRQRLGERDASKSGSVVGRCRGDGWCTMNSGENFSCFSLQLN